MMGPKLAWGTGLEGRRIADLGDGTYRNPVLAGDFPDPTVLKDGADYYLTTSSFDASPGLLIHHSRDLVNWAPLTFALPRPLTTVFAVDLVKHDGRYFIYIPFIPSDASPLTVPAGDHAYEAEVTVSGVGPGAHGGLLLFFNRVLFLGMGWDGATMTTYSGGHRSHWREQVAPSDSLRLCIRNDHHIVTFFHSPDGRDWTRHGVRFETSGYNANTASDLLSLRPALFAAGRGAVTFSDFRYRALG
jgi:beta-xylosidase